MNELTHKGSLITVDISCSRYIENPNIKEKPRNYLKKAIKEYLKVSQKRCKTKKAYVQLNGKN
jgi:hypothetical protein